MYIFPDRAKSLILFYYCFFKKIDWFIAEIMWWEIIPSFATIAAVTGKNFWCTQISRNLISFNKRKSDK